MTIYCDASILVDALDVAATPEQQRARDAMDKHDAIVVSALVWDEVVWAATRIRGKEAANVMGQRVLDLPGLHMVNATRAHAKAAQKLLVDHKLRPRDALHVATALAEGCDGILSIDSDFDELPIAWIQP